VMYRKGLPGSLAATQAADSTEQPFLVRMERRALDGSTPEPLRRSAVRLVNALRIGLARRAIAHGRRLEALRPLWRARRAMTSHRWWLTVAMIIVAPATFVQRWQTWRLERRGR